MQTSEQGGLISPAEAAKYLGVRRATLDVWRGRGHGPGYVKMTQGHSGRVRYRVSELDRWINERCVETTDGKAVQE